MFLLTQATRKLTFLLQRSQKNKGICNSWCTEGLDHVAKRRAIIWQHKARAFSLNLFSTAIWDVLLSLSGIPELPLEWPLLQGLSSLTELKMLSTMETCPWKGTLWDASWGWKLEQWCSAITLPCPLLDPAKVENTWGIVTCFSIDVPHSRVSWRTTNAGVQTRGWRQREGRTASTVPQFQVQLQTCLGS